MTGRGLEARLVQLLSRRVPLCARNVADGPRNLQTRRNTTLTALQALATLNNPFVLRQCEHFAARLEKPSPDVATQIDSACRLAFSWAPTPEEKGRLTAYSRKHGPANACRVLLNSTEFMFVD